VVFVTGTTIERNSKHTETAATLKAERQASQTPATPAHHDAKKAAPKTRTTPAKKTKDAHAGESAAHRKAEGAAPKITTTAKPDKHSGESAAHRSAETGHTAAHAELKPLGIDIESAPFIALAAAASLLLALGAWLRPRWVLLLVGIALAMLVFAALDVREVFHQSDESRTGLAVLAGFVALLHLGAAAVAGSMGRKPRNAPA
jgi:Flp pilus assembly protein TadB